jgi:hypothetical protein
MHQPKISDLEGLVYLATPYSKYKDGHAAAYSIACRIAARVMNEGVAVYSPIAHGHGIAIHGREDGVELASDAGTWRSINLAVLRGCSDMVIPEIDGWRESEGIQDEAWIACMSMVNVWVMDKDGNISELPEDFFAEEDE